MFMLRRSLLSQIVLLAGFALAVCPLIAHGQDESTGRGRKYKPPPPTAKIEVTILKDFNGKPIENAAVVFHPMEGDKDKGNMELKTNEDGKTMIDVIPLGVVVRLQVIARGYQTYGEDYKVDKDDMAIEVRMKRPGEQYSIYKNHDAAASDSKTPDGAPGKDAAPAKPANQAPATPQSTQPSTPQPNSR
jgi:hypothetical protein